MHLCVFHHRATCLLVGLNFYPVLAISALLGVYGEAALTTMCLLMCPAQLASTHLCVYFYNVRDSTPWTFGKILEGSAMILEVSAKFFRAWICS